MPTVTLYGASDDLIEIEGDLREEWGIRLFRDTDVVHVAASTGTLLRFAYAVGGVWRITVLDRGGAEVTHVSEEAGDRVTLTSSSLRWLLVSDSGQPDAVGGPLQRIRVTGHDA